MGKFSIGPNGISVNGVVIGLPVVGGSSNMPANGQVFYVNNSATPPAGWTPGFDGNKKQWGLAPTRPFASIAYAISQCNANMGDIIYVCPGHAESIAAAGGITASVAGVSIIGLSTGSNAGGTLRPVITLKTATTATFKVTGANVTVRNIVFDGTGIDAIAKIFDVQASNFCLDGCEVYFAKNGAVAIKGLVVDTAAHANGLTITNCYIHGDAYANCTNFVQLVGGDSIVIAGNTIIGSFTTSLGAINNITAALTNVLIAGNRIINATALSTKAIVLLTGSTGFIVDNRLGILSGTAPVTADACYWEGNYYAAAVATSGTLL